MLYEKILLSLDNPQDEKHVIVEALRVAKALNASVTVIHVNDPAAGESHMMMDTLPELSEQDIKDAVNKVQANTDFDILIKKNDDYAKEIANATESFDLLIIGHQHKSKILAFLKDSVDEQVSDLIQCPMLVVPEKVK